MTDTKQSSKSLNLFQGATLIAADCLGTGILALPGNVQYLGKGVGLTFLLFILVINFYAGRLLCQCATMVEQTTCSQGIELVQTNNQEGEEIQEDGSVRIRTASPKAKRSKAKYSTLQPIQEERGTTTDTQQEEEEGETHHSLPPPPPLHQTHGHGVDDSATYDFISLTRAVYTTTSHPGRIVMAIYYTNLFLVLGDYILVMSHAVAAMLGDEICLPLAGLLASTLMFALSQIRYMSKLGKSASIVSLLALALVVAACLTTSAEAVQEEEEDTETKSETVTVLRKLSALASIGFAVGSQKLLLNIRHDFRQPSQAPLSLALSLIVFGTSYITVCLFAGPDPPSFLFDAIPEGQSRRVAGLLLWIHVAVSYAINSQALCSSLDRMYLETKWASKRDWLRWLLLTLLLAVSSFVVANALPFFKDLVALIGALTSIPLTLTLPAILYRKVIGVVPVWWFKPLIRCGSYILLLFSVVYTVLGLIGASGSIELDWENRGAPFDCE